MSTYFNGTVTKDGIIGGVSGVSSVDVAEEKNEYEIWLDSEECKELARAYREGNDDFADITSRLNACDDRDKYNNDNKEVGQEIRVNGNNNKLIINIDFDNCLVNSNVGAISYYNEKTNSNSTVDMIKDYSFLSAMPLWSKEQINDIFCQENFFKYLKPFEFAREVVDSLISKGHTVRIVTCHNPKGIKFKSDFIAKEFPMIEEVVYITHKGGNVKMDKSAICGNVLIDDHISNLETAKVDYPICYGNYVYNELWEGIKVNCWMGVETWIDEISDMKSKD